MQIFVKFGFKALKDRPHRTALDQLVMNNYKGSSVEIFGQNVPLMEDFSWIMILKALPFYNTKGLFFSSII